MLAELYHSTGDPNVPERRTCPGITDSQAERPLLTPETFPS